jgi:hypothetical protein
MASLEILARGIYASLEQEALGCMREPQEDDWEPARQFFEERRVQHTDLGGAGDWRRWSEELEGENEGVSFPRSRPRVISHNFFCFIGSINNSDMTRWTQQ